MASGVLTSWRHGRDGVLVEPMLVSVENVGSLLVGRSLHYLPILHWPARRRLRKTCFEVPHASWTFARKSPRCMSLRNHRCLMCGWSAGRILLHGDKRCGHCGHVGDCIRCTNQVGSQLRCLERDIFPEHCAQHYVHFSMFLGHVDGRLSAL